MTNDTDLDRYERFVTYSATVWLNANPEGYAEITKRVMANYSGAWGEFFDKMQQIERECAMRAGVPSYRAWLTRPHQEAAA